MLFMTVGRSAPRYEQMALLYPRSRTLQSHLSEYFIVIVRLCHRLLRLTKKSFLGQMVSFPGEAEIRDCASELDRWATSIKEEVALLMSRSVEEQGSRLRSLLSYSETESHRRKLKAYARVLSSCSEYDHQVTWKQLRKLGSATLFHQALEYQDWRTQSNSCTLLCKGMLGSGKSVLLANMIDDLNLHAHGSRVPVTYFFCCHNISESLKARTVMGSLARQLLAPALRLATVEDIMKEDVSARDFEDILSLLRRALPPGFRAYCVLDGLDECDDAEMSTLIHQLGVLQHDFSLLICVSSRVGADNVLKFNPERFVRHRSMTMAEDNPDIASFIDAELERSIESRALTIGDPRLILEIRNALLKGARGMFLWVALQIGSLCTEKTDEAIRKALADLPKDLPTTFSRILRKSGELSGTHYQTRILELVAVARRPLTTDELQEALSVVPGDLVWNPTRLLNDVYSVLACCGSLIAIDEEALTVRLVHHSVRQFLLDGGFLELEKAEKSMGDIIFTYLNYGVFDTQVSRTVVPHIEAQAAPSKIIRSMDSSVVRSLALRLLKTRGSSDCDVGRVLSEASAQLQPSPSLDQFRFHSYAKTYWLEHAGYITKREPVLYDLQLRALRRECATRSGVECRTLLFCAVDKGWESIVEQLLEIGVVDIESKDSSEGMSPLLRAAQRGHVPVVKLLLEARAYIEATDKEDRTPLAWAAINGHDRVVRLLLKWGARTDASTKDGVTPAIWATVNGHYSVARLLAEAEPSPLIEVAGEIVDLVGETPLTWAAMRGYTNIIKLLLDKGADAESTNVKCRTPLMVGALAGEEAVVKLLLDRRANIEAADRHGRTALMCATRGGKWGVAQLLLEKGADVAARDGDGMTVLMWAVRKGLRTVAQLLLEKGAHLEAADGDGRTALIWAAMEGNWACVELLLEKGANVEASDGDGLTVLMWAVRKGERAVTELLLDRKANLEAVDGDGKTALVWAATEGNGALVELLLERKASPDAVYAWVAKGGGKAAHNLLVERILNNALAVQSRRR